MHVDIVQMRYELVGKVYRHFKGGIYKIVDIVYSCKNLDLIIIYSSIRCPEKRWARPYDEFFSDVSKEDYTGPRFTEVTPSAVSQQSKEGT